MIPHGPAVPPSRPAASAANRALEVELEEEVLEQLEAMVKRPSFLHALENAASSFMPQRSKSSAAVSQPSPSASSRPRSGGAPGAAQALPAEHEYHPLQTRAGEEEEEEEEVVSINSNDSPPSETAVAASTPPSAQETGSGAAAGDTSTGADVEFVLVDREEALESMAYYIALCLAKHPEAQNMTPKQLQQALTTALSTLKQSRCKQLFRTGRIVYRWSTLAYSAVQLYSNPWLIQAVLTALWTFSRMGAVAIRACV